MKLPTLQYAEFFKPSYAYSNIIPFRLFGIQSNKKESNAARGPFKTIEIPKKPASVLAPPHLLMVDFFSSFLWAFKEFDCRHRNSS